jgi:hypothetical protein
MGRLRIIEVFAPLRNVLEGNGAFHIFSGKDRLVFPFDKDLYVR